MEKPESRGNHEKEVDNLVQISRKHDFPTPYIRNITSTTCRTEAAQHCVAKEVLPESPFLIAQMVWREEKATTLLC